MTNTVVYTRSTNNLELVKIFHMLREQRVPTIVTRDLTVNPTTKTASTRKVVSKLKWWAEKYPGVCGHEGHYKCIVREQDVVKFLLYAG
jgi:hypothetical protein